MTFHAIVAICAFLMSLLGTRIAILAMRARRTNLGYDNLSEAAQKLIPNSIQGGGVVLAFAVAICMTILEIRFDILLPFFMLSAMALLEKLMPIPWLLQMVMQMFAISIPLSNLPEPTFGGILPAWLDILIVSGAWLWFINMLKGMDEVDGFAATALLSITTAICIVTVVAGDFPSFLSSYCLIVASAVCGFLWWNWPPAKILLGRVGSIPLGFLIGYLLLIAVRSGYGYAVLIMCAYYVSDSLISWTKRTWRSKPLALAHTEHYYQKARLNGRSPVFIVRSVFGVNMLLIFLCVQMILEPDLAVFFVVVGYISVFMLLWFFTHKKRENH